MKNCIYRYAKRLVDRLEKKQMEIIAFRDQEEAIRHRAWKKQKQVIAEMISRYITERENLYTEWSVPAFKIDQLVLLNPYTDNDGWEPSVAAILEHTPFRGPTEVVIRGIFLDSSRLREEIYEYHQYGVFGNIMDESRYDEFVELLEGALGRSNTMKNYDLVMHYYTFSRPEDPQREKYWRYPLREDKFADPESEVGREILRLDVLRSEARRKKEECKAAQIAYEESRNIFLQECKKSGYRY
jgi:hypothetical protein